MNWGDAVSEGFPPPHEREPGALRQDIADELADHLVCAMTRELRRTDDETAAERAVLDRFGNPEAIARRLWWDAMKERIMKDRLFTILFSFGMLAIVAGFVLPWAAKQNAFNEAILAKLDNMKAPPASDVPSNWARVKIHLVEGTAQGKPVAGVEVKLMESHFNDGITEAPFTKTSDVGGMAEFGPINPGRYVLSITLAGYETQTKIYLTPGKLFETQFVCPSAPQTQIEFHVSVPQDVLGSDEEVQCVFVFEQGLKLGETMWEVVDRSITLKPAGEIIEFESEVLKADVPLYKNRRQWGENTFQLTRNLHKTVTWPAGKYRLREISVFPPGSSPFGPGMGPPPPKHYFKQKDTAPLFEARAAILNQWTVQFPTELLKQLPKTKTATQPATSK